MKKIEKRRVMRVYRAAMRWAADYRRFVYPRDWARSHEQLLARACDAALVKPKRMRKQ